MSFNPFDPKYLIPGYGALKFQMDLSSQMGKAAETMWKTETGEATNEANAQNIAFQREVNAQNQYNMEHAHQIEVADLDAAGLNPWLSVGGGAQAATQQSTQVEPVQGGGLLKAATAIALMAALKQFMPKSTKSTSWRKSVGWK